MIVETSSILIKMMEMMERTGKHYPSSPAVKLYQKFQEAHEQLVVPFVWKAFEKVMQG